MAVVEIIRPLPEKLSYPMYRSFIPTSFQIYFASIYDAHCTMIHQVYIRLLHIRLLEETMKANL